MKKIIYILLFFFLIISSSASENYKLNDITEGNENAKIKIYSYQSLTCPHCASFHEKIYPLLKKDYIDTGIVKIHFKHFPLDLASLNAAKIAQCINKEKRITFLDHLYRTQQEWIKGEKIEDINQNLKKTVEKFGLSEEDFNHCLVYEDLENYILNTRIEAVKKAWEVEGVKEVINEIEVGNKTSIKEYANDVWLSTQIRALAATKLGLRALSYNFETIKGKVFIAGITSRPEQVDTLIESIKTIKGVKEIVNYVIIKE